MGFKKEMHFKTWTPLKDEIVRPFTYYISNKKGKSKDNIIEVPKGFKTDYASIPRLFLPFIPKIGRNRKAAVLHDYLYSEECKYIISRGKADRIFLNAMRILGVKLWRRYLMYLCVRAFGSMKYKKYKK